MTVFGFLARGVGRFAQTRLAALLVWAVFWALLAATAQFGVGLAVAAWMWGYGASRLVWGSWRRGVARGMVALAVVGVVVSPYWHLIIR